MALTTGQMVDHLIDMHYYGLDQREMYNGVGALFIAVSQGLLSFGSFHTGLHMVGSTHKDSIHYHRPDGTLGGPNGKETP